MRVIEMHLFAILKINRVRVLRMISLAGIVATMFLAGCAAPQKTEPEKDYVWPAAPMEPVVRFQRIFRSEVDLEKESSWKDALLGEEDGQFTALATPYAVFVDPAGRLLVADTNIPFVMGFDVANRKLDHIGTSGDGAIMKVLGVTADASGRVYIADSNAGKINIYNPDGSFIRSIGGQDEFGRPVGMAIDDERGRLYVSDVLKHHVAVFDFDGNRVDTIGERGVEIGKFNFPVQIALNASGDLHVVDSMNFRIQIFDPDDGTVTSFGEQGTGPGTFARPRGIAVDGDGNIYVSDAAFNNVQMFNSVGQLLLVIGTPGYGPGGFQLPGGMHVDAGNRLYVADQLNRRVQVFQYLGPPESPVKAVAE
jgi:DNA-binding beta-propeller fold protein YncE